MHFTREPTVETVITPREGCKLVVRSSRGVGCEEFFVDAIEVVVFGDSCFFRSLEKPKAFLLPVTDYEVLEVRETRMVLKAAAASEKQEKAPSRRRSKSEPKSEPKPQAKPKPKAETSEEAPPVEEGEVEKKRERRRQRRRKPAEEAPAESESEPEAAAPVAPEQAFRALIPPPKELISAKSPPPEEEPELVPPSPQEEGEGGFRLFRRFRGTDETTK